MKLNKEDAVHCLGIVENYFGKFTNIAEYIREQKLAMLADLPATLPGLGPEEDLFCDHTMHPSDMEIEICTPAIQDWEKYLNIISSHANMTSIPGRNLLLAVKEKNTNKWIGFIRLGSPLINCKPRNELLRQVFTQVDNGGKNFNRAAIMGFVIVPTQPFGYNYLGGKLMAGICCSHYVKDLLDKKYGMNTCLFETTSLYGSSKAVSQYDGMKPFIRFAGLTDSNFVPMIHGETYFQLRDYIQNKIGEELIDPVASSRKLKTITKALSLIKVGLNGTPELERYNKIINGALQLTEQKRYYYSNYGFKNFIDVVNGKTDVLQKDDNYDKFELDNIIKWWKNKASNRFETLTKEGRIRTELEVWTSGKDIDIIR